MNSRRLNPTAISYSLSGNQQQSTMAPVSAPPSPYLEARVLALEEGHAGLRDHANDLTELYHKLSTSVDKLKKGGWPVTVGPFQEQDPIQSHQCALKFKEELEELNRQVRQSVGDDADEEKSNGTVTPKANGSLPAHLRASNGTKNGAVSTSLPPHLRGKKVEANNMNGTREQFAVSSPNDPLLTDGPVDTMVIRPAAVPSPPSSPVTTAQPGLHVAESSPVSWKPHYLTTLQPLACAAEIPAAGQMVTFHPLFLDEQLGGAEWSPGLRFITAPGTCMLQNRTYYLLSGTNEPYLPGRPGEHGAKLTAFFNTSPEDSHPKLLPEDANTYEDVPMFVEQKDARGNIRYAYFGNYSQTRWSDKLGYDTMEARVPQGIKNYWAKELTSNVRPPWVTAALKQHFFKKPEYEGRLCPVPDDATTVNSEEEVKLNEKMTKDVLSYVEELREWEREANMKTALIKEQFILDAFDAADVDDPPALRLWWEYLECVSWRKDFYDLLVSLQSREEKFGVK